MNRILKTFFIICVSFMCWSCTRDVESGYVVGKKFTPKHTTVIYNTALKRPMPVSHPDRWYIWVADSVAVSRYSVDKSFYDKLSCGQYVKLNKIDGE